MQLETMQHADPSFRNRPLPYLFSAGLPLFLYAPALVDQCYFFCHVTSHPPPPKSHLHISPLTSHIYPFYLHVFAATVLYPALSRVSFKLCLHQAPFSHQQHSSRCTHQRSSNSNSFSWTQQDRWLRACHLRTAMTGSNASCLGSWLRISRALMQCRHRMGSTSTGNP